MSKKRSATAREIAPTKKKDGKYLCSWCGKKLSGRRTRYCSNACSDEVWIRSDPSYAKRKTFRRDKGVCASCGKDTARQKKLVQALLYNIRKKAGYTDYWGYYDRVPAFRKARSIVADLIKVRISRLNGDLWDMDHIKPVSQGGGLCGLENYQTLCIPCHKDKTRKQRQT